MILHLLNKLECLSLAFFMAGIIFASDVDTYTNGVPYDAQFVGRLLALPPNNKLFNSGRYQHHLQIAIKNARDKHSSLFKFRFRSDWFEIFKFQTWQWPKFKKNQYCRYLPLSARFYVYWLKSFGVKFSSLKKTFFHHFLYPSAVGEIQTLDLRIISSLFNHCATNIVTPNMTRWDKRRHPLCIVIVPYKTTKISRWISIQTRNCCTSASH